jgi:hypothetical protein
MYKSLSERQEYRFLCYFWSISMFLDPDPKSKYGSRSRKAKSVRIHADPDPQQWFYAFLNFQIIHCLKRFFKLIQSGKSMRIQIHITASRSSAKILQQRNIFARSVLRIHLCTSSRDNALANLAQPLRHKLA